MSASRNKKNALPQQENYLPKQEKLLSRNKINALT